MKKTDSVKKTDKTKPAAKKEKTSTRRLGVETAENRHALLDAAELIMLEEGYAAVTSRHVANKAGLKPQLVYYYFRTMDDLLLAVFQRRHERNFTYLKHLLAEPQPLHKLWDLLNTHNNGVLAAEFMALANHRRVIGEALGQQAEQLRHMQAEVIMRAMHERGLDAERYPPIVLSMLLATTSQILVRERALGIKVGHDPLKKIIEEFLDQLEPPSA